jgi:uncharacterized SAM-binding protein YcdF (DUF218 family)
MKTGPITLIIILGSPNDESGQLYDVAIGRCELALKLYKKHRNCKFLLTGGYGGHFNRTNKPHAFYLERYLLMAGIQKEDLMPYAESANSIEDATLSKPLVPGEDLCRIYVVTSDYHVKRAAFIFKQVYHDLKIPLVIKGAKTDPGSSRLDIAGLAHHEKKALKRLKTYGINGYYSEEKG